MPDGPADASWLDGNEKAAIACCHHSDFVATGLIFCISGLQLWGPQIVQPMGFSNEMVGVVVAVPFLCATAEMIFWGYASDLRKERIWHITWAALSTALGLIIASISTSHLLVLGTDDRDRRTVFRTAGRQHCAALGFARIGAGWRNRCLQHYGAGWWIFRSDCYWRSQTGDGELCGRIK
jgi:hypothetical protein